MQNKSGKSAGGTNQEWRFATLSAGLCPVGIRLLRVRQAEVTAAKTMIERTYDCFDLWPERLIADTGYGSAEMLNWLVNDCGIEPHISVFDKSKRMDDTFSREDFAYDHASDTYRCPGGKTLRRYRRAVHRAAD